MSTRSRRRPRGGSSWPSSSSVVLPQHLPLFVLKEPKSSSSSSSSESQPSEQQQPVADDDTTTVRNENSNNNDDNNSHDDDDDDSTSSFVVDERYSASDWFHNIRTLSRSTVLRATKGPVLAVMVWSLFLSGLDTVFRSLGYAPSLFRLLHGIPTTLPHAATVSALGLLLVFRTNSAYQKFNEGRQIWERILSISRNLTRLLYLYPEITVQRRQRIFRLLAAFPYLLHRHVQPNAEEFVETTVREEDYDPKMHLVLPNYDVYHIDHDHHHDHIPRNRRGQQPPPPPPPSPPADADSSTTVPSSSSSSSYTIVDRRTLPWSLLLPDERVLQMCIHSTNRPLWVCDRMGREIQDVQYTDNYTSREREKFLRYIGQLSNAVGECERLHLTAVPLNYARHSLRGLTLWLFTLPLALLKDFGWWTAPVMGLAAWLLYGIYQIGYKIEDPFQGSLRLATMCEGIYRDVIVDRRRRTAFNVVTSETKEWEQLPLR